MFGEHERANAQIDHGKAEVETLPQRNRPILRTIHECANQRAEREAGEHETRVLLHIRLRGERDDRNAGSRLERTQAKPCHTHGNQARPPNRLLAPGIHIRGGLIHGGLHFRSSFAFGTCAIASVFDCRFSLQRLGTGSFALTVFLAGHACFASQLRLRFRLGGKLGEEHERTDHYAHAGERERQQAGNHGQRGGERIADHPHAFVEHAGKRKRTVRFLRIAFKQRRPTLTAHRAPRRNRRHERHDAE